MDANRNRMTSVEIQAVSVDEAVRLALEQLALGPDAVEVEILSEAGPDEGDEALVRVTAKGMASQPVPRGGGRPGGPPRERDGGRRPPGPRRVPGDRPSSRELLAKETVRLLLERMGVAADVVCVDNPSTMPPDADDPPTIFVDILGQDLGMLIGRRGEHLAQLQYLVNLLVARRLDAYTRIVVDVEGYRTRREESLVGLAERVARQVARSRRPIQLEPMPPNERRIVHITLRENPDVTTVSNGEGNLRRVTVQPRG